jgi:hypothetical protein
MAFFIHKAPETGSARAASRLSGPAARVCQLGAQVFVVSESTGFKQVIDQAGDFLEFCSFCTHACVDSSRHTW